MMIVYSLGRINHWGGGICTLHISCFTEYFSWISDKCPGVEECRV